MVFTAASRLSWGSPWKSPQAQEGVWILLLSLRSPQPNAAQEFQESCFCISGWPVDEKASDDPVVPLANRKEIAIQRAEQKGGGSGGNPDGRLAASGLVWVCQGRSLCKCPLPFGLPVASRPAGEEASSEESQWPPSSHSPTLHINPPGASHCGGDKT